ncbi:MAG: hypothetical protein AABX79_03275 [Nanoarchaeota archaeon]
MRNKRDKRGILSKLGQNRGQMQLPFGMIVSIILIIAFLVFAFYAIKTFLAFQNNAKAEKFFADLQSDTDRVWRSSRSFEQQQYLIQSGADFVCFVDFSSDSKGENSAFYQELERADYENENLVFYPVKINGHESKEITHLDIGKTTDEENPLCIKSVNGKVSLVLKKELGEALITIER